MSRQIMVIAGEPSGDTRAAEVIRAVNEQEPGIQWFGIGGPTMREHGVETRHDVDEMAVMGIGEVLRRYPFFRRVFHEMIAWADERQPDLALFVDYPGFNLRLARKLHDRGIKTIHYICPQVWAWHRSRIPQMAQYLDHLLTIFPFEAEYFSGTNLPVTYVGHPLVDSVANARQLPVYHLPWHGTHRIGLLPGSRRQEIERLLPVMLEAACHLEKRLTDCSFLVAAAGPKQAAQIDGILKACPRLPARLTVVTGHTWDILMQAGAAMVCSGTATLETALLGCPMAVCYKAHPLTYRLVRPLIRVPHIGMVNIVAGQEVCPELIQGDLTPEHLATVIENIARPGTQRDTLLNGLTDVRARMGTGGAAANAANVIIDLLGQAAGRPG